MTCSHFGSSPTHIYSLRDSVLKLLDMPSEVDLAKRELVKVLRALAAKYKVTLSLTRESSNQDVDKAFRRVSLKVHPDKGGTCWKFFGRGRHLERERGSLPGPGPDTVQA